MQLSQLQHAFQQRVLQGGSAIEAIVPGSDKFPAGTRLGIYEHAFVARLAEALADTYPALHYALSESAYTKLVRAYSAQTPPAHFSIRYYGDNLSAFVAKHFSGIKARVLSDLCQWEWLLAEAFDAADVPVLGRETLSDVAPEQWAALRFKFAPGMQRIQLQTNAVQWWQAATTQSIRPRRWRIAAQMPWVIWRNDLKIYFRSLKQDECCAMDAIRSNHT
ncbi:MAG: DNA-binding domain-containing protein, partial [Steroidobacter sp.]